MELKIDFPLSTITTFQLGGPAKFYLKVISPEEVVSAVLIAQEKKLKYCLVGGGSNTVFADRGFSGLVIHWQITRPKLIDLEIIDSKIIVSGGVKLADLIKISNKNGLVGLTKLAGIPGSVGGAVVGNAGAYNQTISDHLRWVEIFDGERVRRLTKKDCRFAYRDSIFKHQNLLVLRVSFKFKKGVTDDLIKESKKIIKTRWAKFGSQPICAGSFFKNVIINGEKILVAKLIEQSGISDLKFGGISIAPWHHNFLINNGVGTTNDLKKLKEKIKKVIYSQFGIKLEEEVRLIGFDSRNS